MRQIATLLFVLYFVVLTAGLLVSNPFAVAGSREPWLRDVYSAHLEPVGHFLGFLVLGFLASASCWPRRFGLRMAIVVAYALITEALQTLVANRTADLKDVLQNLAGAGVGAVLWWVLAAQRPRRNSETKKPSRDPDSRTNDPRIIE